MVNYYLINYLDLVENSIDRMEEEIIKLLILQDEYRRLGEINKANKLNQKIKYFEERQRYIFMSTERKSV